jgi:hypothetical protein
MAISPVIPNTVQVRLLWALGGQLGVNVLHGIAPGGYTVNQTTTNTLGAAIKSAFTSNLATLMPPAAGLVRVGLRDIRQANQAEFLDSGAAVAGTTAGDMLPAANAVCVTLRTAKAGKSFRGRTYISGFLETQNDSTGNTASGASTAAVAFMNAVAAAFVSSGLELAVGSRPGENTTLVKTINHSDGTTTTDTVYHSPARAGQSNAVIAIQSRTNNWESQRRRMNGRGLSPTLLTPVAQAFVGETQVQTTPRGEQRDQRKNG